MTTTLTAAERAEIRRRNGCMSRGPKTPEGKNRSKFNALRHGMRAKTTVLPGEDAAVYQGRLAAWTADLQPRDETEHALVQQAARASWLLERADRAEAARLTETIHNAVAERAQRRADGAEALGRRLLQDRLGPRPRDSHLTDPLDPPTGSRSGRAGDPDHPPQLLARLESHGAGCRWLLNRWAELRSLLDQGHAWQPHDQLRAIRLLGAQPLDAPDAPVMAALFLACHVLDPRGDDAFAAIAAGLEPGEVIHFQQRLARRQVETLRPRDPAEARRILLEIVDRATSRLETSLEVHQQREAADAVALANLLSFDTSPEGEQLRQFQMSCGRSLLRAIDRLQKARRTGRSRPIVAADIPRATRTADPDQNPPREPVAEGSDANSTNEPETAPSAGPSGEPVQES